MDTLAFTNSNLKLINDMQFLEAKPVDVRLTHLFCRQEYFISLLMKQDDFAHSGMYDQYLKSAHAEDKIEIFG